MIELVSGFFVYFDSMKISPPLDGLSLISLNQFENDENQLMTEIPPLTTIFR